MPCTATTVPHTTTFCHYCATTLPHVATTVPHTATTEQTKLPVCHMICDRIWENGPLGADKKKTKIKQKINQPRAAFGSCSSARKCCFHHGHDGRPWTRLFWVVFYDYVFGVVVVVCCCFLFLLLLYFVDFLVVFLVIIIIMS